MAKVVWTEKAIEDLENIASFHSQYSENYTSSLIKRLFNKPNLLRQMPEMGRLVPEKNDLSIRELIIGNYRIIYQYQSVLDSISILTVHHSSVPFK
ncbi:type II toxin-antitoxin system RelE/ParE family toxin [Pedobacter helvus]|uniref:Type II toxin-antitoxin system RelE/ParE family toxin n=1 Tax=Pedobacter helvus TaxID=2563444 RepID=A0ABW9JPM1_9SPHI|nr:type II toxin-antitoxin system RelE/ParE family toxin [Pedobacter ureilyticus]